jgi:3-hydroxyisobutyrate dehydrogenase-like beta-hydroxyacid dehydrogenase
METIQQPPAAQAVGLVGLGLMGRGIGLSLLRAGHALQFVTHRRRDTADELLAAGAKEHATPQALAAACDSVVLCLPTVQVVEQVLFGAQGIAAGARRGLRVIECSTLLPQAGRDFALRLAAQGLHFVDAPLTRGPAEAVAGRLNALVGGEAAAVRLALPVLAAFCERCFEFGAGGQGYAAKLINNFLAFNNLVAVAEALHTAHAAGLELAPLLAAVQASGGQNRVLDGLTPLLTGQGEQRSRVTLATAHKDVQYYGLFAASLQTLGPQARQVAQSLGSAVAAGLGDAFTPAYLAHVAGARPAQG